MNRKLFTIPHFQPPEGDFSKTAKISKKYVSYMSQFGIHLYSDDNRGAVAGVGGHWKISQKIGETGHHSRVGPSSTLLRAGVCGGWRVIRLGRQPHKNSSGGGWYFLGGPNCLFCTLALVSEKNSRVGLAFFVGVTIEQNLRIDKEQQFCYTGL